MKKDTQAKFERRKWQAINWQSKGVLLNMETFFIIS